MTNTSADGGAGSVEDNSVVRQRIAPFMLLLIGAVLVSNLNCLSAGFVWDDTVVIRNNPLIGRWSALPELLTQPFIGSYYRPLVMLSFAVENAIWGLNPSGFHLTNLILHGANVLLAFVLMKRVSGSPPAAFIGALLFAAHPAHKGVVYISDRTGMLAAFFFLSSLILYWHFRERADRPKAWLRYTASVACCLLAIFSKEEAAMLPVVVIVVDMLFHLEDVKNSPARSAVLYVPFFVSVLLYLAIRAMIVEPPGSVMEAIAVEPLRRLLTIPGIMLDYVVLIFLPLHLDFNPRTPLVDTVFGLSVWVPTALLILIVAAIPWLIKKSRTVAFGVLWFLIVFVPMSNIIPVFPEVANRELFTPIHFLYLPAIGLFLCVGRAFAGLIDTYRSRAALHIRRKGTAVCIVAVFLAYSLLSLQRNVAWKDEISLFGHMVRMHPERAAARTSLGNALSNAGRLEEAVRQLEQAVALEPAMAEPHNSLGVAYLQAGSVHRAIKEFRESIRLKPNDPGSYGNIAVAYAEIGMVPESIEAAETALSLEPESSQWRTHLGLIYLRARRTDDAEREFLAVLERDPDDAFTYNALGGLYAYRKEYSRARQCWEQALRIRPDYTEARNSLEDLSRLPR